MNFFFSTIHYGTFLARFSPPFALPNTGSNNTATTLSVGLYMGADTTVTAITSAGAKSRASANNGAGPTVSFAAGAATKYADLFVFSGSNVLTRIDGSFSQIGPVPGVLDFTIFPTTITGFNMSYCNGYNKVKLNSPGYSFLFRFANGVGYSLDLSECIAGSLNFTSSYWAGITPPANNSALTSFEFSEHRLYNTDFIANDWPNLTYLGLSIGGVYATGINTLRLAGLPALVQLSTTKAGIRNLNIGANNFTALKTILLSFNRLSARALPWAGGDFAPLLTFLTRAVGATTIQLGWNAFTEAETASVVAAIYGNLGSRPTIGTRTLSLEGQDFTGYYPRPANNDATTYPGGPNAPVVTTAVRTQLAAIAAAGWAVTYNKAIVMTASYLGGLYVRVTYGGVTDIDVWAIGQNVTLVSSDTSRVPSGTYMVTGGSGKVWDLMSMNVIPLLMGELVAVSVDKA